MTEQTTSIDPVSQAATASPPPLPAAFAEPRSRRPWIGAVIILVILCAALIAALWLQRKHFDAAGRDVAARISAQGSELDQARRDTRQALALSQAQADKVAGLENAVQEVRSQYSALQQAWQSFNESTGDDVLINDVDRLVTMASQQLRLAGSVSNAIVALEAAQSRLARADRPRMASLQQSINGDLDRLRAVPTIDIPNLSARIERLIGLVDKAPLLAPDRLERGMANTGSGPQTPAPRVDEAVPALPANAPWWQRWRAIVAAWPARAGGALVHELGGLIQVQRVSEPAVLLLSQDQAAQLRSMLKQRLLTAQLALLMRQPEVWTSELNSVNDVLKRYFNLNAGDAQAAQSLTQSLLQTQLPTSLPTVSDSMNAVAAMRASTSASATTRQE